MHLKQQTLVPVCKPDQLPEVTQERVLHYDAMFPLHTIPITHQSIQVSTLFVYELILVFIDFDRIY